VALVQIRRKDDPGANLGDDMLAVLRRFTTWETQMGPSDNHGPALLQAESGETVTSYVDRAMPDWRHDYAIYVIQP